MDRGAWRATVHGATQSQSRLSNLAAQARVKHPLFHLIRAPKHKSSDAGGLKAPKRSCTVLSLSEKLKVLDLIRKEKFVC